MSITVSFSGDHPVDLLIGIKNWAIVMAGLEEGKDLETVKASISAQSANAPKPDATPKAVNPIPAATPTAGIPVQAAPVAVIAQSAPITPAYNPAPMYQAPTAPAPVPGSMYQTPPAAAFAPVPVAQTPTYTLEQISNAGHSLLEAGKMNELLALLARYGVQALNQLRPEHYGAVATELRALGAKI